MWLKRCHKPAMTGNGQHATYKNGDDWGMVYYCFTHMNMNIIYIYILYMVHDVHHNVHISL